MSSFPKCNIELLDSLHIQLLLSHKEILKKKQLYYIRTSRGPDWRLYFCRHRLCQYRKNRYRQLCCSERGEIHDRGCKKYS